MRLSELHAAIEAGRGPKFSEDEAFTTLVAIEHLARVEGIPVSALDFAPPLFGARYTYQFADLRRSWGGRTQYLAWRNLILNGQMIWSPGDVDGDPWLSLCRAERISTKKSAATLYDLRNYLPAELLPRDVTDTILMEAFEKIPEQFTGRFRAGVNNFRQLFCQDLAPRSGLLPDTCPRPLPGLRDHRILTNMSPDIDEWRNSLSDQSIIHALDYLNRLAVAGGRLNGKSDTLNDLRVAICDLPSPTDVGIPAIKLKSLRTYENAVRHALGGHDPRKSPAEQAWADLRNAALLAACETRFLWALGNPAAAQGLFPRDISESIALELMLSYSSRSMWSQFRHGCEQFDAIRGKVPPGMLPPFPLGIRRPPPKPPRVPKPDLLLDPVKTSWAELYARVRAHGWGQKQMISLSGLRGHAIAAGIAPNGLDQAFINDLERKLCHTVERTRLRAAVLGLIELRAIPAFSSLPDLTPPLQKSSHGSPSPKVRAELEELMVFMNAAPTTQRSFCLAVGILTDAMGRPDISLKEILQADMSAYDLGPHEPRRKIHADKIRALREFIELPWTPAWRELQVIVTGTGMPLLDNPVPKILSWNPGRDPDGITKEWAQILDRELRSTVKNPPHGRADLAKTFARHLAAFDALHDIPVVAGSGLLPPRIGPIR